MAPPDWQPDDHNPTAADWAKAARGRVHDAQLLLARGSHRTAYELAGMAVELALKARIMAAERLNRWPTARERKELHTHQLGRLLEISGLRPMIEAELLAGSAIGEAWLVVKDFDINSRYPDGRVFPRKLAEDYVAAVGPQGVVEWLTRGL